MYPMMYPVVRSNDYSTCNAKWVACMLYSMTSITKFAAQWSILVSF